MHTLSLKTSILTQLAWGGAGPILKMLCGRGMCVTKLYLDLPTQSEGQQGSLDGGLDTTRFIACLKTQSLKLTDLRRSRLRQIPWAGSDEG